ncbi:MAG: PAS domain-containing sensor histidine kinase [Methanoregula sp.]
MSVFDQISRVCGILATIIGCLGLTGWILDSRMLTGVQGDYIPMAPNTAVIIILLGLSLYSLMTWTRHRNIRITITGLAGFSLILSVLTLAGNIAGLDIGVDYLFISTSGNLGQVPVGHMSPVTAACFIFGSISLLLLLAGKKDSAALLGTAVTVISGIILIGYWYGAPLLYGGVVIPVALTTASALEILGIGLVTAAGSASWPVSGISGPSTRAKLLRGLLPLILIVVLGVSWINVMIVGITDSSVVLLSAIVVIISLSAVTLIVSYLSREIGNDIDRARSEQNKAEIALRKSEERLKFALEGSNDGIWDVQMDSGKTYISPRGWEILGYMPGEHPESIPDWNDLVYPGDLAATNAALSAYIEGQIPVFDVEQRLKTRSGTWKWIRVRGKAVVRDAAGKPLRMTGTHTDITESKQAEVQREMFIKELGQKNAELERITYTISHDLKSPLLTIKWFAEILDNDARKGDSPERRQDIRRIIESADRMQELLADVLELSRIGRVVSQPEKISFGTIAREAADMLSGPLTERGFTVEIAPDLPVINVDRARIREILLSLLENAMKFRGSQPYPVIRIGADVSGATPVFFIQDNGAGINPRYLDRVFNLFEKLDPSSPGTGVGLTIVKRIIEVHGGKIWAESEGEGRGTTFRFTLPGSVGEA